MRNPSEASSLPDRARPTVAEPTQRSPAVAQLIIEIAAAASGELDLDQILHEALDRLRARRPPDRWLDRPRRRRRARHPGRRSGRSPTRRSASACGAGRAGAGASSRHLEPYLTGDLFRDGDRVARTGGRCRRPLVAGRADRPARRRDRSRRGRLDRGRRVRAGRRGRSSSAVVRVLGGPVELAGPARRRSSAPPRCARPSSASSATSSGRRSRRSTGSPGSSASEARRSTPRRAARPIDRHRGGGRPPHPPGRGPPRPVAGRGRPRRDRAGADQPRPARPPRSSTPRAAATRTARFALRRRDGLPLVGRRGDLRRAGRPEPPHERREVQPERPAPIEVVVDAESTTRSSVRVLDRGIGMDEDDGGASVRAVLPDRDGEPGRAAAPGSGCSSAASSSRRWAAGPGRPARAAARRSGSRLPRADRGRRTATSDSVSGSSSHVIVTRARARIPACSSSSAPRPCPPPTTPSPAAPSRCLSPGPPLRQRRVAHAARGPMARKTAIFALGCFWGAEKDFWETPGRDQHRGRLRRRLHPEPDLPRGLLRQDRPRRGRPRRLRPGEGHATSSSSRSSGSTTTRPRECARATTAGTQYRSAIFTTDDEQQRGRRGVTRHVPGAADRGRLRRDHDRDRAGPDVLLRRGLPPAVPRQECRTATARTTRPA